MSENMCRLCLGENNLSPIFINEDQTERYSAVLALTTGLNIEPNDGLPQQICEDCTGSVTSALNFRNNCHLSHVKLLRLNCDKNILPKIEEKCPKIETQDSEGESNADYVDGNRYINFEIEVECQRIIDQCGESSNTQNGGSNEIGAGFFDIRKKDGEKEKKMSRKEKRDIYLGLVDGVFDPKGPVQCKVCKKTVSNWSCFMSHAKLHLGFKYICEYCGKGFVSPAALKRHCRSFHGMKRDIPCKHCNYLAMDKVQLVLHERRMHTGERPYVCDVCASSFFSRRCLIQHLETHLTVASVQCEQCPLKFKSARHLARHRYKSHSRKRKTPTDDAT